MEGVNQRLIDLQRGFATGQYDDGAVCIGYPIGFLRNRLTGVSGLSIICYQHSIGQQTSRLPHNLLSRHQLIVGEVGIAEPAPQVAAAEPDEHRRTPGVAALALQAVEDFVNLIHSLHLIIL